MIKNCLFFTILLAPIAPAASVSFTKTFEIDESFTGVSGTTEVFDNTFLAGTLSTFDTSLGTLDSFTITWTISGSLSGTLSAPGGAATVAYSGEFFIASLNLPTSPPSASNWFGGGGYGSGGPGGMVLSIPLTAPGNPLSFTQTFLVSEAGISYDQAILDSLLGGEPVKLEWSTSLTFNGAFDTAVVTGDASAEITYDFTAVPEPSGALLVSMVLSTGLLIRSRRGSIHS